MERTSGTVFQRPGRASGAALSVGDVIAGHYVVEELLGEGGMAVVHRATNLSTARACAIKLLRAHLGDRPEFVRLFAKEARVSSVVGDCVHIVRVMDAGIDDAQGTPFIVMELLEGESLAETLERGPLPRGLVRAIVTQLAIALDHAHSRGVVHRDLKPSNLFLTRGPRGEPLLKVTDFGIAKVIQEEAVRTATILGTPAYNAPEQLGSTTRKLAARQGITIAAGVSPATDVWAVGLLAYEMLTGAGHGAYWDVETASELPMKVAFEELVAPSVRAADRACLLPPGFDAWFARCLRKNAAERFGSGRQALLALTELLGGASPSERFAHPAPARDGDVSAALQMEPPDAAPTGLGPLGQRRQRPSGAAPEAPAPTEPAAAPHPRHPTPRDSAPATSLPRVAAAALRVETESSESITAADQRPAPGADSRPCWFPGATAATPPPAKRGRRSVPVAASVAAAVMLAAVVTGGAFVMARSGSAPALERGCAEQAALLVVGQGEIGADEPRALALARRACDEGEMLACTELGQMLLRGATGSQRDAVEARLLLDRACKGGEPVGCVALADQQAAEERMRGRELLALYERACQDGEPAGCVASGRVYERGQDDIDADLGRAASLYREACDAGAPRGCTNLANLTYHGAGGLARDLGRSAELNERACREGDRVGCQRLAVLYALGQGVEQDRARSTELRRRACAEPFEDLAMQERCATLAGLLGAPSGERTR